MIKKFEQFIQTNEEYTDWLTGKKEEGEAKSKQTSNKEGLVDSSIEDFYKSLEEFANSDKSMSVQQYGSMTYSKLVENIQAALVFLGYPLTKYGVDGYFGPETAAAIKKFNEATKKDVGV